MPGLPDFKGLVLRVYERLDTPVYARLSSPPAESNASSLGSEQLAEVKRFEAREYDVVLGMLERRMDGPATPTSKVRRTIEEILREGAAGPKPIHTALIRLADRRAALTIVTTNFDLLLEAAARKHGKKTVKTYALGGIPRPGRSDSFEGVLHIHGALSARNAYEASNLIVTDQDFGEYYLRRRVVPDFIYDAALLFHLVLVGYSANDPPMRYLLNAVAADGSRFDDLKERFAFVGMSSPHDPVEVADWRGRGITPIPYSPANDHSILTGTLKRWSKRRFRWTEAGGPLILLSAQWTGCVNQAESNLCLPISRVRLMRAPHIPRCGIISG